MENRNKEPFNGKIFTNHLLLTFIIMGLCWGTCVVLGMNNITKENHAWIGALHAFGALSTTVASYIALKKGNQVTGFKDWLKHIFDLKHNVWSYVIAIALVCLQALLMCLIGGYEKKAPAYMIFLMFPAMLFGGGLEEAGWRYITFPELDKKFGFVISSFVTGIIWALWHLPLFYIPGVTQYGMSFIGFTVTAMGLSFVLGAIRKVTGSVWLCVLGHSIVNSISKSFRYDFYGNIFASAVTMAILIVVTSVLVYVSKNRKTTV